MKTMNIVALSAGLSNPSSTRLLTDTIAAQLKSIGEQLDVKTSVQVIEIRNLITKATNVFLTGMPDTEIEAALGAIEAADALVAVSPVFAGSYSGFFKTFIDLIGNERIADKPVLIAATGGSPRHSLALDHALRPLFSQLRALVLPTAIFAATADFAGAQEVNEELSARIYRASRQLWQALGFVLPVNLSAELESNAQAELSAKVNGHRLNINNSSGRLRPKLNDFVPMGELLSGGS